MIKKEIERLEAMLSTADPTHPNYGYLLDRVLGLYRILEQEDFAKMRERDREFTVAPFKETPEVIVETKPAEPVYTEVVPADLPPATLPEEPKKEAPTKEEVRALLAAKAKEGVVIEDVLAKYVPEGKPHKFSSIKAADYAAIVEELNHAG